MSMFDNLFGKSTAGASGNRLQSGIAAEFADYKNYIEQFVERENAALRLLGIPLPRLVSEVGYNLSVGATGTTAHVKLVAPRFEYPPFLRFYLKEKLVLTLFENLESAGSTYWWWGLADLIYSNSDRLVWTNRDPFERYWRMQQEQPSKGVFYAEAGDLIKALLTTNVSSLFNTVHAHAQYMVSDLKAEEPPLSIEEASKLHLRVRLYNYATDSQISNLNDPETYYNLPNGAADKIPDDILSELPVAPTWTSCSYSSVKILPSGAIKPAQMIEFLGSLRAINGFFSFTLQRRDETVYFQLRFPTEYESEILSKLNLYFPDFEFLDNPPIEPQTPHKIHLLKKQSMYHSIRGAREFQLDPYAHFASLFDNAAPGEPLCYQVVFAPLLDGSAAILKQHLASSQSSLPDYSKDFGKRLPAWFVGISLHSTDEAAADQLSQSVASTFDTPDHNFSNPVSFHLDTKLPKFFPAFLSLCDTEELAALAHFPITELPIERLEKISMKNVQPPEIYTSGSARIGESKARGQIFPVTMPEEVRDRHLYIVGKSGTGKSTLMETLARRDIEAGRGVAVIDPHGDLIQHLLEVIPEERVSDCVLFSPRHFPVSLEILHAESEHEIDLLSDDLITMFRRTSESWGDKMQAILQMAFQTLLRVPGSSFTDITPLLTDESYRSRILSKINHPQLASFWQHRYDMRQAEPILIRMDRLTTSGTLRSVLTQNKNSLNFYDVITESKIFLADLSKGFLGESTSHLLGSIIVSQIQLAAMRQAHLPQEQRIPFSLFVDEVQNFTTSAFSTILSEARKQKLRLTIAHQFVSQLPGDIQKAVFGNVGTMMFFALSPDDLGAARHELGTFEPQDVANLPKYHALCRPVTAARDTFAFVTDAPEPPLTRNYAQLIIEQTRREYAVPITSQDKQPPAAPPTVRVEPRQESEQNQSAEFDSSSIDNRRPAIAQPLSFATNTEKILHFLRQAEYLSQPQIIALTDLQASNASTALKKLVETNQIKSLDDRRPKIYFLGRAANPTTHNLLVRDLFVKINCSNYAIRSVKFNDNLAELNPDLTVEFVAEDDGGSSGGSNNNSSTPLLAYFELDRGTEGVAELFRKAERYAKIPNTPRVGFIFERESDMQLARKTIRYPFILYATLEQFISLRDNAFYTAGDGAPAGNTQLPFFGS